MKINPLVDFFSLLLTTCLVFSSGNSAASVTLDRVIPENGVAHSSPGTFILPSTLLANPLSTDQDITKLLDNDPDTFYQPTQGSNGQNIGSDVLLDFNFPAIPDDATIESITLRVGISSDTTDDSFLRGFFFASYNRLDLTRYLNVDLGPDIVGGFLVSLETPIFAFPPLLVIQVPRGTVFEMDLSPEELTLNNVRHLSIVLVGLNELPSEFDRTTLVNATVVYSVPVPPKNVPSLSEWGLMTMASMLGLLSFFVKKGKKVAA